MIRVSIPARTFVLFPALVPHDKIGPMKTMIITGASAGIGRALALQACGAGYSVFAVARRPDALAQLANEVHNAGGTIETMTADISDLRTAPLIVSRALDRFGRIDIVVNNAGYVVGGALLQQPDSVIAAQFATHVFGPIALTRHALEALRRAKGQVFFVGSGVARVPVNDLGAYPASKAALRSAVTTIRRELARDGIAVTYVDPGVVDTQFMRRAGLAGPAPRLLISPEEVARKMLRAVETRPRTLNAIPWQTLLVALAELFPRVADEVLVRAPQIVGARALPPSAPEGETQPQNGTQPESEVRSESDAQPESSLEPPPAAPEPAPEGAPAPAEAGDGVSVALEPVARRMERVNLNEEFVRGLLVPGALLELGDVAMRWAGMPNKNERAVTAEVLDALAQAGYLEPSGENAWRVVKAPD
jgi:short-subunit dehydrogenase